MSPASPRPTGILGRRLTLTVALGVLLAAAGCGSSSGNAPFFKNAFADKPVIQTVPMVHGFTLMLVDEAPSRTDATFSVRFKAPEPLDFTLADGNYQEHIGRPKVEINGNPVDLDGRLTSTAPAATFTIRVNKEPGKETKSSHQVRLEVFANGSIDSVAVTPVELEIQGPPGSRWDLGLHPGPDRAPAATQ